MSANAQRVQLGPFFYAGSIQPGAKLWHYEAGTTTDKNIWEDRGKLHALVQPIVADENGMFNFFADGMYKLVICHPDSTGPTNFVLYTLDNWSFLDPIDPNLAMGDGIPSAAVMPVGPDVIAHILGSATIQQITGEVPFFWAIFDGAPLLQHSPNFLLPGSRNRQMKSGDAAFFLNEGGNIFRMVQHLETEGTYVGRVGVSYAASATLAVPAEGDFSDVTGSDVDITAVATTLAGYHFQARFTGTGCQLVNSASLICPYNQDYRIMQNEIIEFRSLGSGVAIALSLNGIHVPPGNLLDLISTAADDGCVLPIGQALNATRYMALAKRCIPRATVFGTTGTSVGNPTFDNTTDVWTLASHGLLNGDLVQLTNAGGALPTGYAVATVYYVISATSNTFQLAATRGGAAVNGTTNGTGTQTVHNKFQMPDARGYTRIALDNLGGSAANVITSASTNGANSTSLGAKGGAQTHTLVTAEMPAHTHAVDGGDTPAGAVIGFPSWQTNWTIQSDGVTQSTGGGGAHSNTQPWMALGVQVRW